MVPAPRSPDSLPLVRSNTSTRCSGPTRGPPSKAPTTGEQLRQDPRWQGDVASCPKLRRSPRPPRACPKDWGLAAARCRSLRRRLLWRWGAELPLHLQNPQNHLGWERPSGSPRHPQHPVHQTLPVHGFTRSWCPRNSFLLSPQTGQLLALPSRAAALPGFLPCVGSAGPSSTCISLGTLQALGTLGTHLSLGWAGSSPPCAQGVTPGAPGHPRVLQDGTGSSRMSVGAPGMVLGSSRCPLVVLGAPGCPWVLQDVAGCSRMSPGVLGFSWVPHGGPECSRTSLGAPRCPWVPPQDVPGCPGMSVDSPGRPRALQDTRGCRRGVPGCRVVSVGAHTGQHWVGAEPHAARLLSPPQPGAGPAALQHLLHPGQPQRPDPASEV